MPLLFAAQLAAAQSMNFAIPESENRWKIPVEAQPKIARKRGVRVPVVSYTAPDGSLKLKRGIVAGMRIAPNANIGLGLFETLPKQKKVDNRSTDNPMKRTQRRSRKAAIGFSLKF